MKNFNQALTDFFIEQIYNHNSKLCWDNEKQKYIISLFFTKEETFKKLNWEVVYG